jgi:hypothetical protein
VIRRRSRAELLLELVAIVVVALLIRAHQAPHADGAPVSLAFFQFIIAAIVEVAKWIADEASTIAVVLWNVLKIVGSTLVNIGQAVGRVAVKLWGFFRSFYSAVLKPFVRWAWKEILRLHAWLAKELGPILKHLRALRTWILKAYDKWLRPIFATIDVTRAILRLLADFHVPFAQSIERKLADLESRLMVPIRFALAKINEAVNWINRIVDLDGLFQRLTLIESQWRYSGDLWNVLLGHPPTGVSASDNAQRRQQTVKPLDARTLADQVATYYATGAGELAPKVDVAAQLWLDSAVRR